MNILLVSSRLEGGAGIACYRLHQGLLEQGISSKLLHSERSLLEGYETHHFAEHLSKSRKLFQFFKEKTRNQINNWKLRNLPQGEEPFRFPHSAFDITKHPLYDWADIINLHWVAGLLDYPSFFRKCRKPIVWTLHDLLPFSGGYHYETGFSSPSYRKLIERNVRRKQRSLQKTNNLSIVVLNRWMQEKSENSPIFRRFPHTLIPNGLDTSTFKPIDRAFSREILGIPRDSKVLSFVAESATNKRKGIEYLFSALKGLEIPDLAIAVVGKRARQLPDTGVERFLLGTVHDPRLMAMVYSAADLFLIPSIEDNLPNTVMESIACGTPVVGFEIGGIPEMIVPGKNGLLCRKLNAQALAESIEKALRMDFDREWIRRDAVQRYSREVQAKGYMELFGALVSKRRHEISYSTD